MRTGKVDENTPHQPGTDGVKVSPILPSDTLELDQPQIDLMNERGRLQGMTFIFAGHAAARQTVEFLVDQRGEVFQRGVIPRSPSSQ